MSRDLDLEKQIDAYVKGQLSSKQEEALWEELILRPDYIELLQTELAVKSILEQRSSANTSDDISQTKEQGTIYRLKQSWKWLAAAASIAILVVAINFLQQDTNQSLSDLTIRNIDISSNLASAPVLRSQKAAIAPSDSLLNQGFKAAIAGNINEALKVYEQIIQKYPQKSAAVKAYLNKGIILYNSGDFKASIASFEQVIKKVKERPVTKEKAYWYLGNAYINLEQLSKARDAIHTTYSLDGIYRKPAYRLLQKLDHELGNTDFDNFEQQIKEN